MNDIGLNDIGLNKYWGSVQDHCQDQCQDQSRIRFPSQDQVLVPGSGFRPQDQCFVPGSGFRPQVTDDS